ncbi:hypothetical protein [Nocardia sp. CDC160]|uniref:hypothetical protein n=1 Tax=Nocardia sp. CDC160 TaxID=3112166 RepID=UPI002DBEA0BA|nr:hypothetical protein [Nocardia sp. CDC160]MEC3916027.1 hypothetical protein [Nocardia sp. CDC160]
MPIFGVVAYGSVTGTSPEKPRKEARKFPEPPVGLFSERVFLLTCGFGREERVKQVSRNRERRRSRRGREKEKKRTIGLG